MRVCIAGIMGSGKSHFGPKLAQSLGLGFRDLDLIIVEREGRSIASIFALEGEGYFRKVESELLGEVLQENNLVVSLGGGTPCFGQNLERIRQQAIMIWLNPPLDLIAQRLYPNRMSRPLLSHCHSVHEVEQTIGRLLGQREPWYSQAHLTVTDPAPQAEELAAEIRRLYETLFS